MEQVAETEEMIENLRRSFEAAKVNRDALHKERQSIEAWMKTPMPKTYSKQYVVERLAKQRRLIALAGPIAAAGMNYARLERALKQTETKLPEQKRRQDLDSKRQFEDWKHSEKTVEDRKASEAKWKVTEKAKLKKRIEAAEADLARMKSQVSEK